MANRLVPTSLAQDTNSVQDNITRRALQLALSKVLYGDYNTYVDGTQITATAAEINDSLDGCTAGYAELNKLSGVAVTAAEMDQRELPVYMEAVSAAKSVYLDIPYACDISTIYVVLDGTTLAPTPDIFSFGVALVGAGNVDMSGNTLTMTTGTTAATGSSVACTAGAASVTKGSILKLSCNGGSTGPAMNARFTVLMDIT